MKHTFEKWVQFGLCHNLIPENTKFNFGKHKLPSNFFTKVGQVPVFQGFIELPQAGEPATRLSVVRRYRNQVEHAARSQRFFFRDPAS